MLVMVAGVGGIWVDWGYGKANMEELLQLISHTWYREAGATLEQIRKIEDVLGLTFPDDYRSFLVWSNGGEGRLGRMYLILWQVEDVPELNEDYQRAAYVPGLVAIGSDGGGMCYALDYRGDPSTPAIVEVPFGDLDTGSIRIIAPSFKDVIGRAIGQQP